MAIGYTPEGSSDLVALGEVSAATRQVESSPGATYALAGLEMDL